MNEIAVLESTQAADTDGGERSATLDGSGGWELFGLGWSPGATAGAYVGRHRAPDA